MRRRVEWSKWISKSVNNESTSIDGNFVDKDNGKQNTKDSPDGTTEIRPTNKSLGDLSLAADAVENSLKSSTDHNKNSKDQRIALGNSKSRIELGCLLTSVNNINVLNNGSNCPETSLGADPVESTVFKNGRNKEMQTLSNPKAKNFGESSHEFSSTFMLDEELELEQKTTGHAHPSTAGRYMMISSCLILCCIYINTHTCICVMEVVKLCSPVSSLHVKSYKWKYTCS